jgi:zinc protease
MTGPERFELPGGAIGFVESANAVPLVSIVVSFRNGGTSDPAGKDGLTRVMTRLVRRGSEGMTSTEIDEAVDTLGAELSLEVGPSTTSVHAQVIRRNLQPFCDLLARILGTPTFDPEELGRLLRESTAELLEARDSDRALAGLAFRRGLFKSHPYARGAAGRPSTVSTLTRDDVIAAYHRTFVRSDAVLGFAGAITPDEARLLGAKLAAAVPDGARTRAELPEPAPPTGRRLWFVDKPERTQTQILLGGLGTWPQDDDHQALATGTAVLGGTFTSRMMREIRSKRGWSYGTSARLSIERRRHAFTMSAAPGKSDCAPCIALELTMLEDFVKDGIEQDELTFIQNYLVRSHAFEIDTAPKRLGQSLEVELLGLPADYYTGYLDHVRAVTRETANAAIARRLSAKDLVIVVVGTASESLEAVKAAIPDLAGVEVVPFDAD